MNKIKSAAYQFVNTQKPEREYVIRLESSAGALVARYFKVIPASEVENETVEPELDAFDPTSTPLMRQLVRERKFIKPLAVTSSQDVQEGALREVGRHIFRPNIGAQAVTGAGEERDFPIFVLPFGSDGEISEPYNHLAESYVVKGDVRRNTRLRGAQPIFLLHAEKADADLRDWTVVYLDSTPFVLEDTTDGSWTTAQNFRAMALLPTIEVYGPGSIAKDGSATLTATIKRDGATLPYSGEIVVETLAGYAPKTRVQLANGSATFKVMALGLDVGDQMRVKVGLRTVSGMADKALEVVAST